MILGVEHPRVDRKASPLDGAEGALNALGLDAPDHFLDRLHRERRPLGDGIGEFTRLGHHLRRRHHRVDQAMARRLGGAHAAPGEQHLHGDEMGQAPGQALHPTDISQHPDPGLGEEELGVLGGDDQVASERQLETAAHGDAVDRGDHRLVEIEQLGEAAKSAGAVVRALVLAELGRGVQVPAGREETLPAPRNDSDAQIVIVPEGQEGLAQGAAGDRVDGVCLGPVEGDLGHVAPPLDSYRVRHPARPLQTRTARAID